MKWKYIIFLKSCGEDFQAQLDEFPVRNHYFCIMSFTSAFKGKNDYEVHFIGIGNITRWNDLKLKLQCANNIIFISKLLDIALDYYYNQYSKEPNDILYKIDPNDENDHNDIDNIILDPSCTTDDVVEEKPQLKTIVDNQDEHIANLDVKSCFYCDADHSLPTCPLVAATKNCHIPDPGQLDDRTPRAALQYSHVSAPRCLEVRNCDADYKYEDQGIVGVFCVASNGLEEHVALGPLVGREVVAATIAIDCDMRHMHTKYRYVKRRIDSIEDGEENDEKNASCTIETIHISSENDNDSNWMRHVRPADIRSDRNITTVQSGERLYLVTVRRIQCGEELRYWDDTHDIVASLSCRTSNKKKAERKTACGGCGLRFTHTLHYRQHCLVHHDTGRSLATRKYHCLVCGLAVVGKEHMRRHAQRAHQGRGAYQCQYCDKYFLRRNYLDVHRRYGCGNNPQRAKPLCDLCGKEFCQPQKLKVHIKRMHSNEMDDVLREFQCKRCMKLLGSRAALQRHLKEVHDGKEPQTQLISGEKDNGKAAVSISTNSPMCTKCGKQFQNKSNLKIHMLTHSGVKPFQCAEGKGCNAAFTTKQCLQFHYRRVHGYQDGDNMPRIERTVDYTIEAYSGSGTTAVPSPPPTDQYPSSPPTPTTTTELQPALPATTINHHQQTESFSPPLGTLGGRIVVSKGSKKWMMMEPPIADTDNGNSNQSEVSSSCGSAISLLVDEADVDGVIGSEQMVAVEVVGEEDGEGDENGSEAESITCGSSNDLNHPHHHPSHTSQQPAASIAQSASTASLLVEAALDSVNCNTAPPSPTQEHGDITPPPLSLATALDGSIGQQLVVDCRTMPSTLYSHGGGLRAGSVSPLLGRYGSSGGGAADSLALQLDLSIYKHYAATVVDTVVRKYGTSDGLTGARSLQQSTPPDIPSHQTDFTSSTDRYMRFLDSAPLSLVHHTAQYPSNNTIDCPTSQLLDSDMDLQQLPLDTTKAKLDLSMSYYDTALEEIRSRLAAYEAAAAATNDMGKVGMYGMGEHDVGGGFMLDGVVGEFRSFEPFVLQGGGSGGGGSGSSPVCGGSGAGGVSADLQGVDMTSSGCRTTSQQQQQYTAANNPPSPCSSPGLTAVTSFPHHHHHTHPHHHRFPPLHLNLDHHLQPPPRLNYSPTLIDTGTSTSAAVVVADLSLRHHHHAAHSQHHHDVIGGGVFNASAYSSHSPPAPGAAGLGVYPPPGPSAGVYHSHYPQYY